MIDRDLIESNQLTDQQYHDFLQEIERIPSPRSPIDGETARLLFEFMEDTGLRINEALHVKKDDINFRTSIIQVTHPKSEQQCKCFQMEIQRPEYQDREFLCHQTRSVADVMGKASGRSHKHATFTPRLFAKLDNYTYELKEYDLLFPVHRYTVWRWGKKAGQNIGLDIFQQKDERLIEGIFLHLFRALCSKRMIVDAQQDPFRDQMIAVKMRHSYRTVTDRYTKIDINYLLDWEVKTYETS